MSNRNCYYCGEDIEEKAANIFEESPAGQALDISDDNLDTASVHQDCYNIIYDVEVEDEHY
jgi:hypothetical protein